jgi:hypothetical protein
MDKDFIKMDKAVKTTDRLAQSIQVMDQIKRVTLLTQPPTLLKQKQYATSAGASFARTSNTLPKQRTL